jgi:hypothetical protein
MLSPWMIDEENPVTLLKVICEYSTLLLGESHRVVEVVAMPTPVMGMQVVRWARPPTP